MNSDPRARTDGGADESVDDGEAFQLDGQRVFDRGRLTIPKNQRERYDIEPGDVVRLAGRTQDGQEFSVDVVPVNRDGAVRIPAHHRRFYGIDSGDFVDVFVVVTGEEMPDGDD